MRHLIALAMAFSILAAACGGPSEPPAALACAGVTEPESWTPVVVAEELGPVESSPPVDQSPIGNPEFELLDPCGATPPFDTDEVSGIFEGHLVCATDPISAGGFAPGQEPFAILTGKVFFQSGDEVVVTEVPTADGFDAFLDQVVGQITPQLVFLGLDYVLFPAMSYGFGPASWPSQRPDWSGLPSPVGSGQGWAVDVVDSGLTAEVFAGPNVDLWQNVTGVGDGERTPPPGGTDDVTYGHGVAVASVVAAAVPDATVFVASGRPGLEQGVADHATPMTIEGLRAALVELDRAGAGTGIDQLGAVLNLSLGTYGCGTDGLVDRPDGGVEGPDNDQLDTLGMLRTTLGVDPAGEYRSGCNALTVSSGKTYQCIVASAGNNGSDQPFYPADFDGVVGVGATDDDGDPAEFSNSGDIHAVGVDRVLGYPRNTTLLNYGPHPEVAVDGIAAWSGTSFAAPYLAGCVVAVAETGGPIEAVDDLTGCDGVDLP